MIIKVNKMKKFSSLVKLSVCSFAKDEEGAQVVEYALIIAVVSIGLVVGLRALNGNFADFITRVANCLTAGGACAA
jgi:pilus assembly protein Flp/PilA